MKRPCTNLQYIFRILNISRHMYSSSGDSSSLMDGSLWNYIDILYLLRSASVPPTSSAHTLISEECLLLSPSSQASSEFVSKSERIMLNDTHNHTPGRRTRSSAACSSTSSRSSFSSSTGSAPGSASDYSPTPLSSRRRLLEQESKAEYSLTSPPGKILFELKKDL